MYGSLLIEVGRYEEAEERLLGALEVMTGAMGPDDDETLLCVQWLVKLYEVWNRPEQRDRYAKLLQTSKDDQ